MAFGSNSVSGSGYKKPAAPAAPAAGESTMPTHLLKIKVGDGDDSKFLTLTGLFMGKSKDGSSEFLKGKTRSVVSVKLDDGSEVSGNQFYIFPKEDK